MALFKSRKEDPVLPRSELDRMALTNAIRHYRKRKTPKSERNARRGEYNDAVRRRSVEKAIENARVETNQHKIGPTFPGVMPIYISASSRRFLLGLNEPLRSVEFPDGLIEGGRMISVGTDRSGRVVKEIGRVTTKPIRRTRRDFDRRPYGLIIDIDPNAKELVCRVVTPRSLATVDD